MANPELMDRLRRAVESVTLQIPPPRSPEVTRSLPAPGDLYVLSTAEDAAVEWMVVREHPDDPLLVLLAPADDFPLAGIADEILPSQLVGRPLVVRCGEACWVPAAACPERLRVGTVSEEIVRSVRRNLAAAARGELPVAHSRQDDADPEYASWIEMVTRTREAVQRREEVNTVADETIIFVGQFSPTPPSGWAEQSRLSLAAKSGGALLDALESALAADEPSFHELDVEGGRLLLALDSGGIRAAWTAQGSSGPPALAADGPTGRAEVVWRPGSQPGRYRAEVYFPWVDGQVALTIGTDSPQSLTIRL